MRGLRWTGTRSLTRGAFRDWYPPLTTYLVPLGLVVLAIAAALAATSQNVDWLRGLPAYPMGAAGGSAMFIAFRRGLNANAQDSRDTDHPQPGQPE